MSNRQPPTSTQTRVVKPPRLGFMARLHRLFIRSLLVRLHRIEVDGQDTMDRLASGQPLVLIPNHVSLFDGVMWGCFLPEQVVMTINSRDCRRGYPAWLVRNHRVAVMDTHTAQSLRTLVRIVRGGATCLVFPEGRITRTGDLHKVNPGAGLLAELAGAMLVPAWVDGPQLTRFSYLQGRVRRRHFPPIRLTFLPPRKLEVPDELSGGARRHAIASAIEGMIEDARVCATFRPLTLFGQFDDICSRVVRPSAGAVEDDVERKVTFTQLLNAARAAARAFRGLTVPGRFVGFIGEPTAECVAAILGLQAAGVPTLMLDPTAAAADTAAACRAVEAELVFASRTALSPDRVQDLEELGARFIFLDDVLGQPVRAAGRRRGPDPGGPAADPQEPCLGFVRRDSTGSAEVVVLSHANVLANRAQAEARLSYVAGEMVYSSFALHTAEGLLGGVLLPLLSGCKAVLRAHLPSAVLLPGSLSAACASVLVLKPEDYKGWLANANALDVTYIRRLFVSGSVDRSSRHECLERLAVRPVPVLTDSRATCFVAASRASEPQDLHYGRPLAALRAEATPDGVAIAGDSIALGIAHPSAPGIIKPFPSGVLVLAHIRLERSGCGAASASLADAAS